jgi:hypothetical protein
MVGKYGEDNPHVNLDVYGTVIINETKIVRDVWATFL